MRLVLPLRLLLAAGCWPMLACGQLQLLPDNLPQSVFAGGRCTVNVFWHNPSENMVSMPVRMQLYEASSSTAAPLGQTHDWKQLKVLPQQTILENASVTIPPVNAKTLWVIQWLGESNKVLGHTDLMAYPANLLSALKPLAREAPIGIFDPQNRLKPLFKSSGLELEDLESQGFKQFSGKLAVIGQFDTNTSMPEWLVGNIAEVAKTGVAVVWIKPPPALVPQLEPAVHCITLGRGAICLVQARVVFDLQDDPQAQLNLVRAAELAVKPDLLSQSIPQP